MITPNLFGVANDIRQVGLSVAYNETTYEARYGILVRSRWFGSKQGDAARVSCKLSKLQEQWKY